MNITDKVFNTNDVVPLYQVNRYERLINKHPGKIALIGITVLLIGGGLLALSLTGNKLDFMTSLKLPFMIGGAAVGAVGIAVLFGDAAPWTRIPASKRTHEELHRIQNRVCKSSSNSADVYARLYTEGNIAHLDLGNVKRRQDQGWIQGYLLAERIEAFVGDVLKDAIDKRFDRSMSIQKLQELTQIVIIPEPFIEEITGIFQGMQRWAEEQGKTLSITQEDLILANKFKDIPPRMLYPASFGTYGSSSVVIKANGSIVAGQTLDWPDQGLCRQLVVKKYITLDNVKIETFATPGLSSVVNGANSVGVGVLVNEFRNKSIYDQITPGMGYGFISRFILEKAQSVENALELLQQTSKPASPQHLLVFDKTRAIHLQMNVKDHNDHPSRKVENDGERIHVGNVALNEKGEPINGTEFDLSSGGQNKKLEEALKNKGNLTATDLAQAHMNAATASDTLAGVIYDTSKKMILYAHKPL